MSFAEIASWLERSSLRMGPVWMSEAKPNMAPDVLHSTLELLQDHVATTASRTTLRNTRFIDDVATLRWCLMSIPTALTHGSRAEYGLHSAHRFAAHGVMSPAPIAGTAHKRARLVAPML
jgi:hypothetical protein